MKIDYTLQKLVHLPRLFKSAGNKSFYSLLKDTGYFEIADQIKEEDISRTLTQYPECIDEWKLLSEDKRTSSGWYFKELDNGKSVVGYFDRGQRDNSDVEFSNIREACAFFIKHEIEEIRST